MADQDEDNLGVILEHLKNLDKGQADIKAIVESLEKEFQAFQRQYIGQYTQMVGRIEMAHARLDKLEPLVEAFRISMETLKNSIQPLITMNKLVIWIAGGVGLSIIGLIWSVITHRVELIFPP